MRPGHGLTIRAAQSRKPASSFDAKLGFQASMAGAAEGTPRSRTKRTPSIFARARDLGTSATPLTCATNAMMVIQVRAECTVRGWMPTLLKTAMTLS